MNMRTIVNVAVALGGLACLSLTQIASADKLQLPRQGAVTYVTYYTSHPLANLDMGELGTEALVEVVGITRSSDGQESFNQMSVRCLFYSHIFRAPTLALPGSGRSTLELSDG